VKRRVEVKPAGKGKKVGPSRERGVRVLHPTGGCRAGTGQCKSDTIGRKKTETKGGGQTGGKKAAGLFQGSHKLGHRTILRDLSRRNEYPTENKPRTQFLDPGSKPQTRDEQQHAALRWQSATGRQVTHETNSKRRFVRDRKRRGCGATFKRTAAPARDYRGRALASC